MSCNNFKIISVCLISIFALGGAVLAQVATSTNYIIMDDSLNVGGGYSTSVNYGMEDTQGGVATGYVSSTDYLIHSGYQQASGTYSISLSLSAASVALSPAIIGASGGSGSGTVDAGVSTDNPGGYTLSIAASPYNPSLICSGGCNIGVDYFKDYTPAVSGVPDLAWIAPSATTSFGFTVDGTDISTYFRDNGSACNAGTSDNTDTCWYGFNYSSYANRPIAISASANNSLFTTTIVKFKTESASDYVLPVGSYSAIIILTAVAN